MTKEEYYGLLQDPRWKRKRMQIIRRDGERCVKCGSKENLRVHHLCYREGLAPWEYNNMELITLCEGCHQKLHEVKNGVATKHVKFISGNQGTNTSVRCIMSFDKLSVLLVPDNHVNFLVLVKLFELVEYNKNCTKLGDKEYRKIMNAIGGKMSKAKECVKRLKEQSLLKNKNGLWYIDPNIFWKGDSYERERFIEKYNSI